MHMHVCSYNKWPNISRYILYITLLPTYKSRRHKDQYIVRLHFSHSGFKGFFFICSWYTVRLSWCNIYSRIGPVHNNWHLCVLKWGCFFFFCWCRRYSSVADDFYYFTEIWNLFQNIYLSIYTGIYSLKNNKKPQFIWNIQTFCDLSLL